MGYCFEGDGHFGGFLVCRFLAILGVSWYDWEWLRLIAIGIPGGWAGGDGEVIHTCLDSVVPEGLV